MNGYFEGRISSIDAEAGMVKVTYPDYQDTVSNWLRLLSFEYNIPSVGTLVGTIINDNGDGVCLGAISAYENPPAVAEGYYKNINGVEVKSSNGAFSVKLDESNYIKFSDGVMTISADKLILIGYDPPETEG